MEHTIRTAEAAHLPSAVLLSITLALGGCAGNPDIPKPATSLSQAFRHAGELRPDDSFADLQWWRQFDDQQLARLVERTTLANHDIRIAVERAKQARAGTMAAASRLFPSLDLTASRSDSRTGLPTAIKQSMPDTKATRAGVDVAWEIDLFGGTRAAASAAEKDAAAARGLAGIHEKFPENRPTLLN